VSEAVELHPYDPDWPRAFTRERDRLVPLFPEPPQLIGHMGSTAIPGLAAKPVIDIIVLVDLGEVHDSIPALETAGYRYRADVASPHRAFLARRHPQDGRRTHHLHIHDDSDEVRRHLLFRDHLRANPAARDAYLEHKQQLARQYRDDRDAYARLKTAFIDDVIEAMGGPARSVPGNR